MQRKKVSRAETAIPCLIVFTKPLQIAGLPRDLYYILLGAGVLLILLLKNLIAGVIVVIIYVILRKINAKDETTVNGFFRMCRKKFISY